MTDIDSFVHFSSLWAFRFWSIKRSRTSQRLVYIPILFVLLQNIRLSDHMKKIFYIYDQSLYNFNNVSLS